MNLTEAKKLILSGEYVLENHSHWCDMETILSAISEDGFLLRYKISPYFGLNKYGSLNKLLWEDIKGRPRIIASTINH